MKYLFLLFTLVSVAVFSCSKDNDNNPRSGSQAIVGTWSAQSLHTVIEQEGEKFELTQTYDDGDYSKVTFKSDGTYTAKSSADGHVETDSGTYSFENGKLNVTSDNDGGPFEDLPSNVALNCKVNGGKMTLSYNGKAGYNGQQVDLTLEVALRKE